MENDKQLYVDLIIYVKNYLRTTSEEEVHQHLFNCLKIAGCSDEKCKTGATNIISIAKEYKL